jgi:hypothetical protein
MNTSALTLGIPAVLIAAGLLYTSQETSRTIHATSTLVTTEPNRCEEEPSVVASTEYAPIWLDNLALANSVAAETGRPLMVVFR